MSMNKLAFAAVLAVGLSGTQTVWAQQRGDLEQVTAVSCLTFTVPSGSYDYDANDAFAFGAEGDGATFAQFREALRVGAEVQVFSYSDAGSGRSAFAIVNSAESQPGTQTSAAEAATCAAGDALPRTGMDVGQGSAVLGTGLLVLGLLMVRAGRRVRPQSTA